MVEHVFFGGKGGVGKTTIASAYALKCARAGLDTLIVSTDPAHSTSDVFDQTFGDDPRPVEGVGNLRAMEIDPESEVQEHLQETKRALGDQLSAAMVSEIDLQIEMAHQTPGAYEAALLDRFIDVMRAARPRAARVPPRRPARPFGCFPCPISSNSGSTDCRTNEKRASTTSRWPPLANKSRGEFVREIRFLRVLRNEKSAFRS